MTDDNGLGYTTEMVEVKDLKPHPKNYQTHPEDQIEHLIESIKENGFYRNVVIAKENTILAGHGATLAAKKMGLKSIPVYRLDLDPDDPKALKVLTGDNEISTLAFRDDRLLASLLKTIHDSDPVGLFGTGYDEMKLANLVYVTRPAGEIAKFDEAAHWVGLPEYQNTRKVFKLIVNCDTENDLMDLIEALEVQYKTTNEREGNVTISINWPERERDDLASVEFLQEVE